jgi:hypothetical protein
MTLLPATLAPTVAQSTDIETFLGDDLLAWLALAIGAALALGTLLALVRPPGTADRRGGALERPPLARSLVMIGVGAVAAVWGLATLLSGG